jgi:DNA-binding response OmpR family regulator
LIDAMAEAKILIVEDDANLAAMMAAYLEENGFSAAIEGRGDHAVPIICATQPSLVVLDLMLPGKDGLAVCREVRGSYAGPILMLTARGGEADEIVGLEVGADDYLAKPVRPRVLLARVRALLRRPSPTGPAPAERVVIGRLTVDAATREAEVSGATLPLTSGEFDLLWLLVSSAGHVLSRKLIHERLRGSDFDEFDRSIDLRVSRLRHKIQEASGGDVIKTIRGVGYLYVRG